VIHDRIKNPNDMKKNSNGYKFTGEKRAARVG